jgi:hypothetical protein
MLEAARAIISDPAKVPAGPVLFLFDGGEEAVSPAGELGHPLLLDCLCSTVHLPQYVQYVCTEPSLPVITWPVCFCPEPGLSLDGTS